MVSLGGRPCKRYWSGVPESNRHFRFSFGSSSDGDRRATITPTPLLLTFTKSTKFFKLRHYQTERTLGRARSRWENTTGQADPIQRECFSFDILFSGSFRITLGFANCFF